MSGATQPTRRGGLARLGLLIAGLLLALRPLPAAAVTELQFWHALDGPNGELVTRIAETFNASQPDYRVVPVYKGSYAETISSGITAYRTGAAPHRAVRSSRRSTARTAPAPCRERCGPAGR